MHSYIFHDQIVNHLKLPLNHHQITTKPPFHGIFLWFPCGFPMSNGLINVASLAGIMSTAPAEPKAALFLPPGSDPGRLDRYDTIDL